MTMKKRTERYLMPAVHRAEIRIERGFAVSMPDDSVIDDVIEDDFGTWN